MYIEKRKRVLGSVLAICFCFLFLGQKVFAESIVGSYKSESLGDVLYFSTEGKEKTEVEKQAEKAVLESEAHTEAETNPVNALTPLGSFKITGYCPCYSCSEGYGRRTASGRLAIAGRTVAVDPRVIPLGTRLLIDGKEYVAEDIGGAVKHKHIDIFFDSHKVAHQVLRYAEVYRIG